MSATAARLAATNDGVAIARPMPAESSFDARLSGLSAWTPKGARDVTAITRRGRTHPSQAVRPARGEFTSERFRADADHLGL